MSSNDANNFAFTSLTQEQLDALSSMTVTGSDESETLTFKVQDQQATSALRSRRLKAYFEDPNPPYTRSVRSQSLVAAAQASMAEKMAAFDFQFEPHTSTPPRRHTH